MANYQFVIDSTFQPFSMQEMLVPFVAYKDAFEKSEEAYNDLSNKADSFKYLSETLPEDSKARKLYEGYANDLREQAEDLAHNGLNIGNRSALTSLKRRYQGEIGRLTKADEAMREEKKLRQTLNAQDSSRLYAMDNLSIDDFLDGSNPNLYSVSGNELYTKGAAAGKAASSRVYGVGEGANTLGGYYRDFIQRNGYDTNAIEDFYNDISTIPELQNAMNDILVSSGASDNLRGINLERAKKNILRGIMDGAIYQESHSLQRDLGVLTQAEKVADARAKQQMELRRRSQDISLASQGLTYDPKTGNVTYDSKKDPSVQKASAIAQARATANGRGSSRTSAYNNRNKDMKIVGADTGAIYNTGSDSDKMIGKELEGLENARELTGAEMNNLVDGYGNIKNPYLRNAIGNGNLSDYEISIVPKGSGSGWFSSGNEEDAYILVPRESKRAATQGSSGAAVEEDNSSDGGTNDVPQ